MSHHSDSLQVALHTLDSDEAPLLQYLASARDVLGRPLYDPQFALRLARQRGCLRACITLFCDVGMYEVGSQQVVVGMLAARLPQSPLFCNACMRRVRRATRSCPCSMGHGGCLWACISMLCDMGHGG